MTRFLKRFRKEDAGHASIEFAIMFPVFFFILLSSIELGVMTVRSALLERALDVVVREIRLTTGSAPSHQKLREMLCSETNVVPDCLNNLALEMYLVDPRAWAGIPAKATCTNRAEEVDPVVSFSHGMDNELMILRACAKFTPMFTDLGISALLQRDGAGDSAIVAKSAFVQEPR
ncbi:TadE/TadG family type IV pilus assembly protein [Shimia sp.]|uniref:TadE/TadG family type IV pilus assembly protein n=1 Tax=Shimia sp. TaxID=1954381 RepID=UPI0035627844